MQFLLQFYLSAIVKHLSVFNLIKQQNLNVTTIHINVNSLYSQIKHQTMLDELSIYMKLYHVDKFNNTYKLDDIFK